MSLKILQETQAKYLKKKGNYQISCQAHTLYPENSAEQQTQITPTPATPGDRLYPAKTKSRGGILFGGFS